MSGKELAIVVLVSAAVGAGVAYATLKMAVKPQDTTPPGGTGQR